MNQEQYANLLRKAIKSRIGTQDQAALVFRCSQPMVALVLQGKKFPNELMLGFTGHQLNRVTKVSIVKV